MSASLPVTKKSALSLDPRTYERGLGCVHCGLCLPACPTYVTTGLEGDSPRGRIQLMLGLADGKIDASEPVRRHLDLCLDCRACETACPSGVVYHELIEATRARLSRSARPSVQGWLMRWIFFNILTHPTRLKLALLAPRLLQKLGIYPLLRRIGLFRLLPAQLRKMEQMLPAQGRLWPPRLSDMPATGRAKGSTSRAVRVGFFSGCIGAVMFDKVNRQAAELLSACGADVIAAPAQTCCGAIHHHNGAHQPAEQMARRNIDAFYPEGQPSVDWIVTTVAGCGALLREYDHLLRDDPRYAARAKAFSARVRDISELLLELGLPEIKHSISTTATYHDACHLAHAQKVTSAPRLLLDRIPGLKLVPLAECDMCCGAAGTYNLTEPEMSGRLADRKLDHIAATGASICVTGNVGCAMQIASCAAARGQRLKVLHPVELLHATVLGSGGGGVID